MRAPTELREGSFLLDFKEKYPYVRVGTLEPMRIKDILTKDRFLSFASILEYE